MGVEIQAGPKSKRRRITSTVSAQEEAPAGSRPSGLSLDRTFALRLAEPLAVLRRGDERLDHLGLDEVAVELVEFLKPEVVARVVGVLRVVGVAAQVAEEL